MTDPPGAQAYDLCLTCTKFIEPDDADALYHVGHEFSHSAEGVHFLFVPRDCPHEWTCSCDGCDHLRTYDVFWPDGDGVLPQGWFQGNPTDPRDVVGWVLIELDHIATGEDQADRAVAAAEMRRAVIRLRLRSIDGLIARFPILVADAVAAALQHGRAPVALGGAWAGHTGVPPPGRVLAMNPTTPHAPPVVTRRAS